MECGSGCNQCVFSGGERNHVVEKTNSVSVIEECYREFLQTTEGDKQAAATLCLADVIDQAVRFHLPELLGKDN